VAVTCAYDERMVIKTPDFSVLDPLWEKYNKSTYPLEKIALPIMRDLARLNPQGHVHAEELYSAVNVVKKMPSCSHPATPLFQTVGISFGRSLLPPGRKHD